MDMRKIAVPFVATVMLGASTAAIAGPVFISKVVGLPLGDSLVVNGGYVPKNTYYPGERAFLGLEVDVLQSSHSPLPSLGALADPLPSPGLAAVGYKFSGKPLREIVVPIP